MSEGRLTAEEFDVMKSHATIGADAINKAMVQALGLMGQVYGLVGILVGIESADERDLAEHFDLAQGFFWSQPLGIEQLGSASAVSEATAL